jgi:hypothetical protein
MSTPLRPNSNMEGPELYAPRRARMQSAAESEDSPPLAAEGHAPDLPQADAEKDEQHAAFEGTDADSEREAQARLDDAIKAVLEERLQISAERLPRAANLRPPRRETVDDLASPASVSPPWKTAQTAPLQPRLEPQFLAPPPVRQSRGLMSFAVPVALAVGFAAIVAFGITMMSSFMASLQWPIESTKALNDSATAAVPMRSIKPEIPPTLVVKNQTALVNKPLSLAISVKGEAENDSLVLAGLAQGTRLSAGAAAGDSGWRLPSTDLGQVYVYAPPGFVGVMNAAFDLVSPDQRLMDSRTAQLEWRPAPSRPADLRTPTDKTHSNAAVVAPLDPQLAAHLMEQGENSLKLGDIAAARLAFRRLAEAGNAGAARALAQTFDPRYLAEHNVIGIPGDQTKAQAWYLRAKQLGSAKPSGALEASAQPEAGR